MAKQKQTLEELQTAVANYDGPMLSIRDLHVWFELRRFGFGRAGYVRAVDGVSFNLNRGEAVAVVGESGCGKSSLMKTILGINIPTKGDVYYADVPMGEFSVLS